MSEQQTVKDQVTSFPLEEIELQDLNPNVMSDEEEKALEADMKENGPLGVDPIELADKGSKPEERQKNFPSSDPRFRFICVNGSHRIKTAKQLHWKEIRAIINPSVKDQVELFLLAYRKNAERGSLDPGLEARLFTALNDRGLTDSQIARQIHRDRSYVSHRRSLVRLEPKVLQILEKVPRMDRSHLEVLAPLPAKLQEEAAEKIMREASKTDKVVTERQVSAIAKQVKEKERALTVKIDRNIIESEKSLHEFHKLFASIVKEAVRNTNQFAQADLHGDSGVFLSLHSDANSLNFKSNLRRMEFNLQIEKREFVRDGKALKTTIKGSYQKKKLTQRHIDSLLEEYSSAQSGLSEDEITTLTKLQNRLSAGHNLSQLTALLKLRKLAGV